MGVAWTSSMARGGTILTSGEGLMPLKHMYIPYSQKILPREKHKAYGDLDCMGKNFFCKIFL